MLSRTSIIILNYTKYSDSAVIVNALSDIYGRISFILYGINKNKQSKLISFQPLFILDTQIYYKPNRSIQKIKEYKLSTPLINIVSDIRKSSLAIFLAEVISKTVKEEYIDKLLFDFIKTSILILEELEHNISIFHILFLIKLSKYLGFYQEYIYKARYFDYKEGVATNVIPTHKHYMDENTYNIFIHLNKLAFNSSNIKNIDLKDRDKVLEILLDMYKLHIHSFNNLKSYSIFKEIFEVTV